MSAVTGFPESIADIVGQFAAQHALTIMCREVIGTGKSGAHVCLVDCEGTTHNGLFILKVDNYRPDYDSEVERHGKALHAENFSGKVPVLLKTTIINKSILLLMNLAGESQIHWQPLAKSPNEFSRAYALVGKTLTPKTPSFETTTMDWSAVTALLAPVDRPCAMRVAV